MRADYTASTVGVLLVCFGLCSSAALAVKPLFPGGVFPVGDEPRAVAAGDLNGDQIPDLVTANFDDDTVSVLLGIGDGSFSAAVDYDVDYEPAHVALGDLNGDEVLDLAVAGWYHGDVSVLMGLGDGTFASQVRYSGGAYTAAFVVISDLNSDQDPDLVVANYSSNTIGVLPGLGDGTFGEVVTHGTGNGPIALAIGDLDADQFLDIAVAQRSSNTFSVLYGEGDGTFSPGLYGGGDGPTSIAIGDLNDDQVPDVALANYTSDCVSVVFGYGHRLFLTRVEFPAGDKPQCVAIADVNADQIPDLTVSNEGSDDVSVLLGNGDGTFAAAVQYGVGGGPRFHALSDLDGDQVLDLAVAEHARGDVSVLLGAGGGTFVSQQRRVFSGDVGRVALGDVNGDQVLDLTVTDSSEHKVRVLLGVGDGTYGPGVGYATGDRPQFVAIEDLDGDELPDLVVSNGGLSPDYEDSISVLLGLGDGTFAGAVTDSLNEQVAHQIVVGDLNGDEVPDLALPFYGVYPDPNGVKVLFGVGDGTFSDGVNLTTTFYPSDPASVAIGDLNGDQVPDLAAVSRRGSGPPGGGAVSVLLGLGDGNFLPSVNYEMADYLAELAIGDLNGDQIPDLVVADGYHYSTYDGIVHVLLGIGDGTFDPAVPYFAGHNTQSVVIADFNGDRVLDAAAANPYDVAVFLGYGDGTLATPMRFSANCSIRNLVTGDVDGDQAPDLVVSDSYIATVSILLNQRSSIRGDLDHDGELNLDDHAVLAVCMVGPETERAFGCHDADLDWDGDVDLVDFFVFEELLAGGSGPECRLQSSVPEDGWIDARQPLDNPVDQHPVGWDEIELTFNLGCDASRLGPDDFTLTELCEPGACDELAPGVQSFTGSGNTGTLILDAPVEPKTWTVIGLTGGPAEDVIRLGYLPGDADGSETANSNDITQVVDVIIAGDGPLHQFDINRSGQITAVDITVIVELLYGLNGWESYNGVELPPLP